MKAILLLLTALAVPGAVSAQDDPLRMYRMALILYQGGQIDDALRIAGSWKAEAVRRDARRLIEDRDVRLAPGVALLMTELARRATRAGGPERFGMAEMLVSNLPRRSPDIKPFQERWYAFMASMFIDELDPYGGRALIDRALRLVIESSRLQLLSGIVLEVATYPHATCPTSDCRLNDDQRARHLTLAANAYRQAIALEPNRQMRTFGWHVCCTCSATTAARAVNWSRVEQLTGRADLLYLVALFHADLNRDAGDLRGAATEAERAVSLGPKYQSARIALAHLSDQLGMTDRSGQIVNQLLQLSKVGDPWWEFRQPTIDTESLQWMRVYVRQ